MRTDSNQTVQFFFDPVSPYAWLASKDIGRLLAAGLTVDCQPVLFAGLLNAHGQKGPAEVPAKRIYTFSDVLRLAAKQGYEFKGPPTHPFNPLRALRMCVALQQPDERWQFTQALLEACWEKGEDLSNARVLDHIAETCGLGARQLGKAAEQPDVKAKLLESTNAAVKLGVFGVPTFRFNEELFWGGDRLDSLLWRRDHPSREDAVLQEFLQRSASAQRKPA